VHTWHRLGDDSIIVSHPGYPDERHPMRVYELREGDRVVRFAAGEYSNGVWGFYVPA